MTVALIAGFVVPAVVYMLQTSTLSGGLVRACLPLIPLAFAVALATAVPDVDADRGGGKATLAVRLGPGRAIRLHAVAQLAGSVLFGRLALSLRPFLGAVAVAALLPVLAGSARHAPAAARGSGGAAERVGLLAVASLGWASASTAAILFAA